MKFELNNSPTNLNLKITEMEVMNGKPKEMLLEGPRIIPQTCFADVGLYALKSYSMDNV